MDVSTLTQLINGVGFPIVACGAMGWYIYTDRKDRRADREARHLTNSEMYKEIMQTVENNTRAIEELLRRFERKESDEN